VYSVAWSPDGYRIASASKDYTVQVWDAVTGKRLYTLHADSDAVSSLAWSPDGKRIASGGFDSTVRVWNALTGEDIQVYNEHQVQVWDAFTGNNLLVYRGHSNKVWSVAWDPEGKRIASASKDQTVQVWWAA
jgi:WD40 repeat protein